MVEDKDAMDSVNDGDFDSLLHSILIVIVLSWKETDDCMLTSLKSTMEKDVCTIDR